MPYAINGTISHDQMEGSIKISKQQYLDALAGMQEGKVVTVDGGMLRVDFPPPDPLPEPSDESDIPLE